MIDHIYKQLENQLKTKAPIYKTAVDGSIVLQNIPFVRYTAYLIIINERVHCYCNKRRFFWYC